VSLGILGTGYKLKAYAKCSTALLGWQCNGSTPLLSYSEWYGVSTTDGLHVSSISLEGIDIKATLPDCLGNLTTLTTLSLGSNQLYGTIPGTTISKMASLEVLDLSNNYLTGTIPTALAALSALVTLKLSVNSLTGTIPTTFGDLSVLSTFYMASNQLTGVVPSQLCSAGQLMILDIQHNSGITCYQSSK
jgi:Leucine-rich repeat (LRR) protein